MVVSFHDKRIKYYVDEYFKNNSDKIESIVEKTIKEKMTGHIDEFVEEIVTTKMNAFFDLTNKKQKTKSLQHSRKKKGVSFSSKNQVRVFNGGRRTFKK